MKKWLFLFVCGALMISGCVSSQKVEMAELRIGNIDLIRVNDSRWDGQKVPTGEQGKRCGGDDPHFPSLTFDLAGLGNHFKSNVIDIVMSAYDLDWTKGQHGKWRYLFDSEKASFTTPKIPSETMRMPDGVKGILPHSSRSSAAGYYLAPSSCRAGGGHRYFTDIILTLENGEKVVTRFSQGVY